MDYINNKKMNETPIKTGFWISRHYIPKNIDMWVCSECRSEFSYDAETGIEIIDYNYCPNCGIKMKGK